MIDGNIINLHQLYQAGLCKIYQGVFKNQHIIYIKIYNGIKPI